MSWELSVCRVKRFWTKAPLYFVSQQLNSALTDVLSGHSKGSDKLEAVGVVISPWGNVVKLKDKKAFQIKATKCAREMCI